MFSCEFCEISKNTFFTEHVWTIASYIQNQRHIQNSIGVYSEPCQTSTMEGFKKQLTAITIVERFIYFPKTSLSCPLVH